MSLPSVMNHAFSRIPAPQIQRSSFDRSHGHKTTFDTGYLIPVLVDEILPGDTVSMRATFMARVATLLFPIMDNMFLDSFWFYVPNRILWNNWERFNGAQDDPDDSVDFSIPKIQGSEATTFDTYSLGDYFGIPVGINFGVSPSSINALPFRGYNKIWNDWFRDQNSQDSAVVDLDDGPDSMDDYYVRRRGKRHDYFTSCLPFPQKGEAVSIPLAGNAPVYGSDGQGLTLWNGTTLNQALALNYNNDTGTNGLLGVRIDTSNAAGSAPSGSAPVDDIQIGFPPEGGLYESNVYAALSMATSATINQLREAFAIQQILELDARGGTRYIEIIKAHFGVTVQDFRLQRAEYLGGSSQRIDIRAVPQTGETGTTPQGNLAAYSVTGDQSGFVKSFDEHGYLYCLVNVRADITYQQGLHRMWTRDTRYDFYLPSLAHLGEQAVLNQEIYATGNLVQDNSVFGYQERWAEYRYKPSYVTGSFRSNLTTGLIGSLDSWHLALDFEALPVLDDGVFIQDNPPVSRITALRDELDEGQQILMDCYFQYRHVRPMPVYSVPGLDRL